MVRQYRPYRSNSTMRSLLTMVTIAGLMVPASSQAGPQPCPSDPAVSGYSSIFSLNSDMFIELARIGTGGEPQDEYIFVLCPNMEFDFNLNSNNDTTVPLMPVLDESIFQCGAQGSQLDSCVFLGGTTQVVLEDSSIPEFPLETVEFRGVTFAEFEVAAVAGGASDATNLYFVESNFEDFEAESAVVQQNPAGNPFSVDIFRGFVRAGVAGSVFINDGGILSIDQLGVIDVTAMSLVSTANLGTTFIDDTDIASSSIETVISTVNRARTDATNVLIHDMEAIMTAYSASDTSILNIEGGSVYDNAPANLWVGVEVDGFSTGTIDMTTFVSNENIDYVFLASSTATITITDTNVTDSIGGQNLQPGGTSSVAFVNLDSQVNWERVEVSGVSQFLTVLFVSFRSNIDVVRSCIDGTAGGAVFIDDLSNFTTAFTFIDPNFDARAACMEPFARAIVERPGGECFEPNSTSCDFDCSQFATESSCVSREVEPEEGAPTSAPQAPTSGPTTETSTPTAGPTATETGAPTSGPTEGGPRAPTAGPTSADSDSPSSVPTSGSSASPSTLPSISPSGIPSTPPTTASHIPSMSPSVGPTSSLEPSGMPSLLPTITASRAPSVSPSRSPSATPSISMLPTISSAPSQEPTVSFVPTSSVAPTGVPSVSPTSQPSSEPSTAPTAMPSTSPSGAPTEMPSGAPTAAPSASPAPSAAPSTTPTLTQAPTASPQPSAKPSSSAPPSLQPSELPSSMPSTLNPTSSPTPKPTSSPTLSPTSLPTSSPTDGCLPRPPFRPGVGKGKGKGKGGSSYGKGGMDKKGKRGKGRDRSLLTRYFWVTYDDDFNQDGDDFFCPEPSPAPSPIPISKRGKGSGKRGPTGTKKIQSQSTRPANLIQNRPSTLVTQNGKGSNKVKKGMGMRSLSVQ